MTRRSHQAQDIKTRADQPSGEPPRRCIVPGCSRPTQRSARDGLSDTHCRNHVEHRRRHGSTWRRSYKLAEIIPFRRAAQRWLREHRGDQEVIRVIAALDALIDGSGRAESAFRLRTKTPEEKARNALARLREAGKRGAQLLEITLTVKATQAALGPRANPEFQHVQIAKMIHRLASGTIMRNHQGIPLSQKYAGRKGLFERYPRAEGGFMRVLGKQVEDIAGIAADHEAVQAVLELAMEAQAA